jgi:hypothetical protein
MSRIAAEIWPANFDFVRMNRNLRDHGEASLSDDCASVGSGTTSAVIRPDSTVQCYQAYGVEGLLIADLDLNLATRVLASRCRTSAP